ncbi:hypothetical protein L226DRAFT_511330 [Lentinus tigrinus ALCF2SS1-7]|uniref:Uncharacterized protein n=1 Tax=Lentinus tigrinus ALCF2SS1-6 TaxID=1328759 RepID=A0A5C2S3W2_9APHY|nr:hypothetical protein L227DRAFT_577225 [Lentinus tigrinus ALCF2SS1-6]RPD73013.1 hypothetical protein L226DRAFT_511330 [Lentinus tigrinus ALCF2SS1-7]
MLSLSEAAILSTTLEAVLYGLSLFMMFLTFRTLLRTTEPPGRDLNWGMLAATCALLLLSTSELGVNIARLYRGFITKGPHLPGGPDQYFAGASDSTFLVKSILYDFQTAILDAVVIYRAYVVWQSVLVVAVPILGWIALIISCIGLNATFARTLTNTQARAALVAETGRWITAAYSLTLATNLLTTFILAFKIWTVARRSARYQANSNLTSLLHVIIESGAIYSVTITIALATFVAKNTVVYVVLDMISPIISIVFSMIIVRVGLAREESSKQNVAFQGPLSWSSPPPSRVPRHHREDSTFEIGGATFVEVTQTQQPGSESAVASQVAHEGPESEPLKANNSFELDVREERSFGKVDA